MPTLLCIDDHTYNSAHLHETLIAHGYDVVTAPSNGAAMEFLANVAVDAVVMDCHAGGPDSAAFISGLRTVRPTVPLIMVAAFCGTPCGVFQLADACVQKSDSPGMLLKTLELVMRLAKYGPCRAVPGREAA